jgi:hypothetical protein
VHVWVDLEDEVSGVVEPVVERVAADVVTGDVCVSDGVDVNTDVEVMADEPVDDVEGARVVDAVVDNVDVDNLEEEDECVVKVEEANGVEAVVESVVDSRVEETIVDVNGVDDDVVVEEVISAGVVDGEEEE